MSKTKGGGSTRNGRDSNSQRLGVKVYDGTLVTAGAGDLDRAVKDGDGDDIILIGLQTPKHVPQSVGVKGIDGALELTALHLLKHGIVIMKAVHRKKRGGYAFTSVQNIHHTFGDGGFSRSRRAGNGDHHAPAIRAGGTFEGEGRNFTGIVVNFTQGTLRLDE